ncbi:ead/Ea22-like family protein [Atlantibacter sp.]|uniref:ead/Ea22-like family protein n=1 Tax=Atlantibacter sp. TaxID=1903473 RepID=UPI003918381F
MNTTELIARLKLAAEKASNGEWVKESGDGWEAACSANDRANSGFIIAHFEGPDAAANRKFVQAANPVNVLALVEALGNYKAAYGEEARDKEVQRSVTDDALCKLLPGCQYMDPPDGGSVTPLEQVARMVEDYRRRIAELEARTSSVRLPPYSFFDFKLGSHHASGAYVNLEAMNKELAAAGIKLQIEGE